MSGRYSDRFPLKVVKDATEKVQYPGIDIEKLRALAGISGKT